MLPVKKLLSSGRNNISITIHPAPQEARKHAEAYPYEVPTMKVSQVAACLWLPCRLHKLWPEGQHGYERHAPSRSQHGDAWNAAAACRLLAGLSYT